MIKIHKGDLLIELPDTFSEQLLGMVLGNIIRRSILETVAHTEPKGLSQAEGECDANAVNTAPKPRLDEVTYNTPTGVAQFDEGIVEGMQEDACRLETYVAMLENVPGVTDE